MPAEPHQKGRKFAGLFRYCGCVLNLTFLILGLMLFGLALWFVRVPFNTTLFSISITSATSNLITYTFSPMIMVVGIGTTAVAVLGLLGMTSSSKYLLGMYFLSLILMAITYVTLGFSAIWLNGKIGADLCPQLQRTFLQYFEDSIEESNAGPWSLIQKHMLCCGLESNDDFRNISVTIGTDPQNWDKQISGVPLWPKSCCIMKEKCSRSVVKWGNPKCTAENAKETLVDVKRCQRLVHGASAFRHNNGCVTKTKEFFQYNMSWVYGLCFTLFCLEIVQYAFLRELETETSESDDTLSIMTAFSVDKTSSVPRTLNTSPSTPSTSQVSDISL